MILNKCSKKNKLESHRKKILIYFLISQLVLGVMASASSLLSLNSDNNNSHKVIIGWVESVYIDQLKTSLLAKIDTGAKTSSLHATEIKFYKKSEEYFVEFLINHKSLKGSDIKIQAPILGWKKVKSSNGISSMRPLIQLNVQIGPLSKKVLLTLFDRTKMKYPLLLGREALQKTFVVDPGVKFLVTSSKK